MKKYYKVYGVYGMNECTLLLRQGAARVSVTFSGGSTAGGGITPAQFDTRDPLFQHIIEHSEQFESGRIVLLRSEALPSSEAEEALEAEVDEADDDTAENEQAQTRDEEEVSPTDEATEEADNTSDLEAVEVSCLADAKDYLVERFGYKKTSLRGADVVVKAGAKHGVRFVGDLS